MVWIRNLRRSATARRRLTGLLAALLAHCAAAGLPPGGPGGPGRPPGGLQALIAVLDADQDLEISSEEMKNAPTALLSLDRNKDGVLSRDELPATGRATGGRGGPGGPPPGGPGGRLAGAAVGGPPGLAPPTLVSPRMGGPALKKGGGGRGAEERRPRAAGRERRPWWPGGGPVVRAAVFLVAAAVGTRQEW